MKEINDISAQVQRTPDKLFGYQVDERTVVVLREGILVPIEKELIRLGNRTMLKYAKRHLEKRYLHNDPKFETMFHRRVLDVFVDWDFDRDTSVIVYKMG